MQLGRFRRTCLYARGSGIAKPYDCRPVWHAYVLPLVVTLAAVVSNSTLGQEQAPFPTPIKNNGPIESASPTGVPVLGPGDKPFPITLSAALQLAGVQPLDIALASQRIQLAAAQLEQTKVLWLPTLNFGADYYRHDGQVMSSDGRVFGVSKSSFMAGAGPTAVFAFTDALFAPLAARQVAQARQAELQTATNDSLLRVADAYFNVQQARGDLAGALDAEARATDLARRAEKLAPGLALPAEAARARADLAERREDVATARERWQVASAELVRILRLDPSVLIEPVEPPHLSLTLIALDCPVDSLIPVALSNRPELAAHQALVQATLQRLRQEKLRPLIPSLLLHGTSTPPETLGFGVFGGGRNSNLSNFSARTDIDLELIWELQNLGFGNRARVDERRAERQAALVQLLRMQDQVAADVVRAYAQVQSAATRIPQAEGGLHDALDSVNKNFQGLGETVRAGDLLLLAIRPQEVVAAIQALTRAYTRYFGSVADYNRAQFRLYWAIGRPAKLLGVQECLPAVSPPVRVQPDGPSLPPPR